MHIRYLFRSLANKRDGWGGTCLSTQAIRNMALRNPAQLILKQGTAISLRHMHDKGSKEIRPSKAATAIFVKSGIVFLLIFNGCHLVPTRA